MRVLLVKPRPTAVQFGLAPFFQTEPLGLEYVASALIPPATRWASSTFVSNAGSSLASCATTLPAWWGSPACISWTFRPLCNWPAPSRSTTLP